MPTTGFRDDLGNEDGDIYFVLDGEDHWYEIHFHYLAEPPYWEVVEHIVNYIK